MKLDRADAEACGEGLGEIIRRLSRLHSIKVCS